VAKDLKDLGCNCWNCGGPGINYSGSRKICPSCEVVWFPITQPKTRLNEQVVYYGAVIDVVDFSDPMAPSSPG